MGFRTLNDHYALKHTHTPTPLEYMFEYMYYVEQEDIPRVCNFIYCINYTMSGIVDVRGSRSNEYTILHTIYSPSTMRGISADITKVFFN